MTGSRGGAKSKVITARLNGRIDNERVALDIYDEWLKTGASSRQVITSALLALGKQPLPELSSGMDSGALKAVRHIFNEQMAEFQKMLLRLNDISNELADASVNGYSQDQRDRVARKIREATASQETLRSINAAVSFTDADDIDFD